MENKQYWLDIIEVIPLLFVCKDNLVDKVKKNI